MSNHSNRKTIRAERPDTLLFNSMMGIFFLFFAVAPAYWAFYNYGEFRQTTAFVKELKEKPEQFLTPDEKKEKENRIFFLESGAARRKLETILSAAGSFVLLCISTLLFRKAFKSRGVKNVYEDIDWRVFPPPNARIEVDYTNFQNILFGGLIAFFVLLTAFNLFQTLTGKFSTASDIIVKATFSVFVFAILSVLIFLMIRANRRAVKLFDASGVTRGDGRHFAWTEFQGVVTQKARNRFGKTYVWREELAFKNGETAWLIPNRIKNRAEVFGFLAALPQATVKY